MLLLLLPDLWYRGSAAVSAILLTPPRCLLLALLLNLLNSLLDLTMSAIPASLLDRTMILYGTNLGDANAHSTTNLPTLFAGGGFKHGQHLAFDRERNYPLPNLFVSMLQRMGLEEEKFASSTGVMRGLEMT